MYQSRYNELNKLMKIMNELSEEISIIKKDINNKNENQSKELVSYIEEEIKQNINSIKELENPFLLFIIGSGNYGKSTLINALLQDKIIETSDIPNTWKLDMFIKSDDEKLKITYSNEKEIVKSLSSGKMLLKEEEHKLKMSKLEISKKILSYKSKLSKEKLKEFKLEQEKLYLYKSDIEQIQYYLNNKKILNDFNIVDTPGLNQTLLKNTLNRMNKYYKKSDGVLWLIDAQNIVSKENNKLIDEINKIDNLHEKKIIGVVNKIDLINNDKDIKRIKAKVNELYKNKFNDIVYISARDALNGYINNDKELIAKSNINTLYKAIEVNFKSVCEKKQIASKYKNLFIMKNNILEKIYTYKRSLYKDISIYNEVNFKLKKSYEDIYLYILNHIENIKKKRVYNKEDLNTLIKTIEKLEKQCSLDLEKTYITLINRINFTNSKHNYVNTNMYFSKSKNLIINQNNYINIERNTNKLSNYLVKLSKSNTTKVKYYEHELSNHIYKNITKLEEEIKITLKYKLDYVKKEINEFKESTFEEKYLDYKLIKNHISSLDNIENILRNLR